MFHIGDTVDARQIALFLGYKNEMSIQGGVFSNDGKIVLLDKQDAGGKYGNYWDPIRPDILHFYATPNGVTKGKEVDMTRGKNADFKQGKYPIHVFREIDNREYVYLGLFERNFNQKIEFGTIGGRTLEILEVRSLQYDTISEYIDDGIRETEWTDEEMTRFASLYDDDLSDGFLINRIAESLNKRPGTIAKLISDIRNKGDSSISKRITDVIESGTIYIEGVDYVPGYDKRSMVKIRCGQNLFRQNLDRAFDSKCCITGITERQLLRASHIIPWAESDEWQKTNPSNGLLLNTFHDGLFDKHLMTVYSDGDVAYGDCLKSELGSVYGRMCEPYSKIEWPGDYEPDKNALKTHNRLFESLQS